MPVNACWKLRDGVPTGEEETLFAELGARIRDVRAGSDGALYLLTDEQEGRLLRVTRNSGSHRLNLPQAR
ncbi:PQQ-dependent sugar dehydrogenase [Sphingobium naphthae]|uniref:PQQ-dependent sugar dehydrogenase n=1 Tax=Sphingomonadales TaxID=204457 RepID=UPI00351D746A